MCFKHTHTLYLLPFSLENPIKTKACIPGCVCTSTRHRGGAAIGHLSNEKGRGSRMVFSQASSSHPSRKPI